MHYLEIQGLFKNFCHIPRTFQDRQPNSRAFQYCMNPVLHTCDPSAWVHRQARLNFSRMSKRPSIVSSSGTRSFHTCCTNSRCNTPSLSKACQCFWKALSWHSYGFTVITFVRTLINHSWSNTTSLSSSGTSLKWSTTWRSWKKSTTVLKSLSSSIVSQIFSASSLTFSRLVYFVPPACMFPRFSSKRNQLETKPY